MSIVGFPVDPNNVLNACTCVHPISIPRVWALQRAGVATALLCPISAQGLHQPVGTSCCLTPCEASGLYVQPGHLGLAGYTRVRSDEFK